MRARVLGAFLLIIAMTIAATAHPLVPLEDSPAETKDAPLTFDEELEARSIAELFARRFEESNDLLSIVDDLYVKDFDNRLRNDPAERFIIPIASDLALRVRGDELRRCHITTLKFYYLSGLLYGAWYYTNRPNAKPDDNEKEPRLVEVLPPGVIALLERDPGFAEMLLEDSKKGSETSDGSEQHAGSQDLEKGTEDHDVTIKTIERLRSHVSILEQAVAIMREHLQTLPVPQTLQSMMDSMRKPDQEPESDPPHPRVIILAQDSFGCPKGTRLISIKVMPFEMELLRVDGQLKILNVSVAGD
jgi:hypothetical protein